MCTFHWIGILLLVGKTLIQPIAGENDSVLVTFIPETLQEWYSVNNTRKVAVFKDAPFVVYFDLYQEVESEVKYVTEMVELFSTRFQYMSIFFYKEANFRESSIFRAVTMHNRINSDQLKSDQIEIFATCKLNINFEKTFVSLLQLADEANDEFNGTVRYIILSDFNPTYDQDFTNTHLAMSMIASKEYKLGIKMDISNCNNQLSFILKRLPTISFIVFRIEWRESFFINGVERSLQEIRKIMLNCKKTFTNQHPSDRLGFDLTWPDTNSIGSVQNQSALVVFWTSLANLGKHEQVTIFMDQAFDVSTGDVEVYDSNGWWSSDLREKMSAPMDITRLAPISEPNTSLCDIHFDSDTSVKYIPNNDSNIEFNRALVTVVLDFSDSPLTDRQYQTFLGIISERFNRLMVQILLSSYNTRMINSGQHRILTAVAMHNQMITTCDRSRYTHIESSIAIGFNISEGLVINERRMVFLTNMIEYVNEISNNTVTEVLIYLQLPESESTNWVGAKNQVKLAQKILQSRGLQLGVIELSWRLDDYEYRQPWSRYILPFVNSVYSRYRICGDEKIAKILKRSEDLTDVLEYAFANHARLSQTLNVRVQRLGINLDLHAGYCPDNRIPHSMAANFWLNANRMAEEGNISLLIGPGMSRTHSSFGEWWRLSNAGGAYVVQEYQTVTKGENEEGDELLYTILSIILVACFCLFFVAGGVFCGIKCRRTRRGETEMFSKEKQEFLSGCKDKFGLVDTDNNITEHLCALAYDTSIEITSNNFSLDDSNIMGSGAFGLVCMAQVTINGDKIWTAAKSLNLHDANQATSMRSLLMEIKILMYLGKHENITQLVGAHTSQISHGKVYIFLELCHYGSLHSYLRRKQATSLTPDDPDYVCLDAETEISEEQQLLKWSIEIARGMEYMSSKFIVHADLATRNVLLDKHKTAKICDFGLSRRMENYQNYVKESNEPLPWRWMAYESLANMEFSTKSDVLSYGVTIWEIYSEGKVPYPGLTWTCEFTDKLQAGLRLQKPDVGSENLYKLMHACWNIKPQLRPDFEFLCTVLETDNFQLLAPPASF